MFSVIGAGGQGSRALGAHSCQALRVCLRSCRLSQRQPVWSASAGRAAARGIVARRRGPDTCQRCGCFGQPRAQQQHAVPRHHASRRAGGVSCPCMPHCVSGLHDGWCVLVLLTQLCPHMCSHLCSPAHRPCSNSYSGLNSPAVLAPHQPGAAAPASRSRSFPWGTCALMQSAPRCLGG